MNRFLRIFIVVFFTFMLGGGLLRPTTQAQSSSQICGLTPETLEGLGFNVGTVGLGFNVGTVGLGFNVGTVGLGFNVGTVGLDSSVVTDEILSRENEIGFGWLTSFMQPFYQATDTNSERTAVIILDNQSHGQYVKAVYDQADAALRNAYGPDLVDVFPVNIGAGNDTYNNAIIASELDAEVQRLRNLGYERFVVNMSFGMIVCQDNLPTADGGEFSFNLATALNTINNINMLAANPNPSLITLNAECRTYDAKTDEITVHIRYTNPNPSPLIVPYDSRDNKLVGDYFDPVSSEMTPIFFYRNSTLPGQPSQSLPYPDAPIQITYPAGEDVGWRFYEQLLVFNDVPFCEQTPEPLRTATAERPEAPIAEPAKAADLIPVVECVQYLNDLGVYQAHFGIINNTTDILQVGHSSNNFIDGTPYYSTQTPAFLPTVFGKPETASGPYPNTVLNVLFDDDVEWNLNGNVAIADTDSPPCWNPRGYGLMSYLVEFGGIAPDNLIAVLISLFQQGNAPSSDLQQLLSSYLEESTAASNDGNPNTRFRLIPLASAGNFAAWFAEATGQRPDTIAPLAPASWPETIAVAATFGDASTPWTFDGLQFTHNGEVAVPGGVYVVTSEAARPVDGAARSSREDRIVGTSYAAPALARLLGTMLTYPEGCTIRYSESLNGDVPPVQLPSVWDNSVLPDGMTFDCGLPRPADCNYDGQIDAADSAALNRELTDRDGSQVNNAFLGSFFSNPFGCDADGNGQIDELDRSCLRRLLFDPQAKCG